MSNKYGISEKDEKDIRARDAACVYCRKEMVAPRDSARRKDWATIEHLNRLPPWDNPHTVAICCGSCNSSRGKKELLAWFKTRYCVTKNINTKTVSAPVKEYVGYIEDFLNRQNWTFAKTMPEIPHYYVVRNALPDDDKKRYDALDEYIKKNGYIFVSKEYSYLNVGDWKYWIIGTILNRALVKHENNTIIPMPSKSKKCPKCGAEEVKRIRYGYPPLDYKERKDEVLGGCLIYEDNPRWYCGACQHEWK